MGYPLELAARYLGAKSRGAFVSAGIAIAILGVTLGVAALLTVMSVTGGFHAEFRKKVLGVNAHVLVLKHVADFTEYDEIMQKMHGVSGVVGVAPFTINPMMVTHGSNTETGVLLKGVDPVLMPTVLDLPGHIVEGSLDELRRPGAKRPEAEKLFPNVEAKPPGTKPESFLESIGELPDAPIDDAAKQDAGVDGSQREAGVEQVGAGSNDDGEAAEGSLADAGAPTVGAVTPDGGYGSTLPEDIYIPPEVDKDPCSDADASKDLPRLVVGVTLARNLKLDVGSCVTITSPTIGFSYSRGVIRPPIAKQFRVIAVFDAGFDQYDAKLMYTDIYEAQALQDHGDSVTGVEMRVGDIDDAHAIKEAVKKQLASRQYLTMDWQDLNRGLFTALRIQQILMSAVLALIILVASFTEVATLVMIVLQKKKEIAVLKAMGATDWAILKVFVYQGGIIGVSGTVAGLALGLAVCKGLLVYGFKLDPKVYFISQLPVQVRPLEFLLTGAVALTICLVATIAPSLYAARLRPAEGVRAD